MYYGEKFNSITHFIGLVLSLVGLGALIAVGISHANFTYIISFAIFGATLVVLYLSSTLYHSINLPRVKKIFQKLDHVAIYLLIAGTYTPYMLISLKDDKGVTLLAFVWTLAFIGILLDLFKKRRIEILQTSIYLIMGWTCVVEIDALKASIAETGFNLLVIGGLLYSIGVIFYVLNDKTNMKHAHGIWHIFVLVGSLAHFISIIGYVR